jgi:hypothetical protein
MEAILQEQNVLLEGVPTFIAAGRGLHSFPIQLNLSSSVQRMTRLSS